MSGTICEARTSKVLAAAGFLALLITIGALVGTAYGHPIVPVAQGPGATEVPATGTPAVNDTLRALDRLRSLGYAWSTDAGADKAIRHWQKVNGLQVDGIVGPITLSSLGLSGPATATVPAVRHVPPGPAVAPPAPPQTAPGDACAEMQQYRIAAGLPEQFDAIGYRESRCLNAVGNSCCFGWLQLYLASHQRSPGYRDGVLACGVTQVADIRGNSDAQKRAQMCVAKVLYDVSGMSPWSL